MPVFNLLIPEHFQETIPNEKPPKIIVFSCPEPQNLWVSLDFLVRTYIAQPPCLLQAFASSRRPRAGAPGSD